ncbi:MAG: hypothetical protein R2911_31005 [Caldilineaceae bacterium]
MSDIATFTNCPHIGLREDRSSIYMMPTPAHSCFVRGVPFTPNAEHQHGFCLQANHCNCPLFSGPVRVNFVGAPGVPGAPPDALGVPPSGPVGPGLPNGHNGHHTPPSGSGRVLSGNVPLPLDPRQQFSELPADTPPSTPLMDGSTPLKPAESAQPASKAPKYTSEPPPGYTPPPPPVQQNTLPGQDAENYAGAMPPNDAPTRDSQNEQSAQAPYLTPPPPSVGYEAPLYGAPYNGATYNASPLYGVPYYGAPSYGAYTSPKRRRINWLLSLIVLLVLLGAGMGYVVYTDRLDRLVAAVSQRAGAVTDLLGTRDVPVPANGGGNAGDAQTDMGAANGAADLDGAAVITQSGEIMATNGITIINVHANDANDDNVVVQIAGTVDAPPTPKRLTAATSNVTPAQPANAILEALATPASGDAFIGPQPAEQGDPTQTPAAAEAAPTATPTASATATPALPEEPAKSGALQPLKVILRPPALLPPPPNRMDVR